MKANQVRRWWVGAVLLLMCGGAIAGEPRVDKYGGYTGLKGHNDSGFFRVELVGDRYYLMTPENHAFISATFTTALWQDRWGGFCPPLESYPAPHSNKAKYNNERSEWVDNLKSRIEQYGFNGLGCWCEPGIEELTENVHCLFISHRAFSMKVKRIGRGFPDVFDPKFAEAAEVCAKALKKYADSPYRIGSFPDNEIGWVGADCWGKQNGPPFPDAFIALPAIEPGKQYWATQFLKGKYGTIEKLNDAYGTAFTGFSGDGDTLVNVKAVANDVGHPAIYEDKKDFVEAIADQYYRIVTTAMRKYDPNHLIFSARWALWTTAYHVKFTEFQDYNERIWKKAGEYCDVIAINSYIDNGVLEKQHQLYSKAFRLTNKPFMITEWAAFADDTQYVEHKEWKRFQRERGEYYFEQSKTLLDFKFPDADGRELYSCVGTQWFQYADEPSLGRTDGERNNYGLTNTKDEAYQTVLDVMKTFNTQLYDYVINKKPLKLLAAPVLHSPMSKVDAGQLVDVAAVKRVGAKPQFEWKLPEGGKTTTLLMSPEKCFPQGQTIRVEGVTGNAYTPNESLGAGLWYWCARAVDADGLGGRYSGPVPFYIEPAFEQPTAHYLRFEDLSGWQNVSLEDNGWAGVVWAFMQEGKRNSRSVARVQFTVNSLNKKTGEQRGREGEIVWRYCGPVITSGDVKQMGFGLMPYRATDVEGEMTVSSRYLSVRVKDSSGKVLCDGKVDADGKLEPMNWKRCSMNFDNANDGKIAAIEFYVDMTDETLPWDQRLTFRIDDLVFAGSQ